MNNKSVLVIDDSSTIRRLCDSQLSGVGYQVLMAANAEDGVAIAKDKLPDLIILDHQLPGTTGYDVACQLLSFEATAKIPVVASSTLRKKAYAEYLNCDNVVDMLPKPYTPEALIATVESAINTAKLVVQSQCDGSSVPEVINAMGESDLAGAFGCFGVREIIDLLNNGEKTGVLEVETDRCRVSIFVDRGRIQAVTASGVSPEEVASHMPEGLAELAPVIKFTVAGRRGSEVDGLVELLNNKVLDPRLLKKLLRLQAAVLLRRCFRDGLKSFRFDQHQPAPALFNKLPLEASLLSLLVEGAMICDVNELPVIETDSGYVRRAIRGQNLDRAGLASRHMQLMGRLSEPASSEQLAQQLGWSLEDTRRVLHGFELADLVERCRVTASTKVFGVIKDTRLSKQLNTLFGAYEEITPKFVRDLIALKLLLRRQTPSVLLIELADQNDQTQLRQFISDPANGLEKVRVVIVPNSPDETLEINENFPINLVWQPKGNGLDLVDAILSPSSNNDELTPTQVESYGSENMQDLQTTVDSIVEQH